MVISLSSFRMHSGEYFINIYISISLSLSFIYPLYSFIYYLSYTHTFKHENEF